MTPPENISPIQSTCFAANLTRIILGGWIRKENKGKKRADESNLAMEKSENGNGIEKELNEDSRKWSKVKIRRRAKPRNYNKINICRGLEFIFGILLGKNT